MRRLVPALVLAVLLVVSTSAYAGGARHATAEIRDPSGNVLGFANFTEDAAGRVHVSVHVQGLTPGQHGIHLHAVGACAPDFAAAGGHFNPGGHQHGLDNPAGPHAGDLPNLEVNPAGVGRLNAAVERVTLSAGPLSLFDQMRARGRAGPGRLTAESITGPFAPAGNARRNDPRTRPR